MYFKQGFFVLVSLFLVNCGIFVVYNSNSLMKDFTRGEGEYLENYSKLVGKNQSVVL